MIEFNKEHLFYKKILVIIFLSALFISLIFFAYYFGRSPQASINMKEGQKIGLTDSITIDFDRPVNRDQVVATLTPPIEGSWEFNNSTINRHLYKSMTFTPSAFFQPDTEYHLNISNIKNASNIGKTLSFDTKIISQSIPKIASTSPTNNSDNILPNQPIEIKLTEPNNEIVKFNFSFVPEAPFELKINDNKDTYTLLPTLEQSKQYILKIDHELTLLQGKRASFEAYSPIMEISFKTKNPPAINKFVPSENNVKIDLKNINIEFNEEMNKEEVLSNISISPNINGNWSWTNSKTVSFATKDKLNYETVYTVLIKKGVHDSVGGFLAEDTLFKFSTIGTVKTTSHTPKNNSTNIPLNSNISINFDQEVDKKSAENNFNIGPITGGSFSWNNNTLIFNPTNDLQQNTRYTITLKQGIKSIQGLDSKTETVFGFTTEELTTLLNIAQDYQDKALSCEVASLKMALSYKGIKVSETDLMNIVGYDPTIRNGNTWGDPDQAFVGNINGKQNTSGYGVHWNPIARAAKNWRDAKAFSGGSPQQIASEISKGNPVVVWGITGSNPYRDDWITPEGKQVTAWKGEHARVIVGFKGTVENPTAFIINDPINGRITWSTNRFLSDWNSFNNSGVVVY